MPSDNQKPFENCATGIKREDLAKRFTQYLNTRDTEKHAFPVNLNGAWGTGKTFFVDNWKLLVEQQGHIGIKIDAWESDYLDDPLTIIIAEIIEQLKERCNDLQFHEQEKKVANALVQLKSALPAIAKALIGIFLGKDAADSIGSIVEAIAKTGIEHQKYEPDLNMGELGLEATRAHIRHKQFIKDFKDEVGKLVDIAQPDKTDKKVFVFIDELDRCRPTYAIEMLETVKHLFDIPNFVFVFSTDTKQLQHSIKAVYGQNFDSHEYLSRFFEQRLTLPEPDFFEFLQAELIFENIKGFPLMTLPQINNSKELRAVVALIADLNQHKISLRRLKQLCMQVEVTITANDLKDSYYSICSMVGLIFGAAIYSSAQDIDNNSTLYIYEKAFKTGRTRGQFQAKTVNIFKNPRDESFINLIDQIDICEQALSKISLDLDLKDIFASESNHNIAVLETAEIANLSTRKIKSRVGEISSMLFNIPSSQRKIIDNGQLLSIIENLNIPFEED
ncbi:KAP family P-loop NTPase fold protein [Marinomonas gallaica]|uniref:KAP family P-loop NTPase fold protein n=1 Tax=Marinomonas gallaica TaxID=1806667 RepID=UPI003CE559F2